MSQDIIKIEPPNWWTGMHDPMLQLLVYGKNISEYTPTINYQGVSIIKLNLVSNPDYLFIDLMIDSTARAGKFPVQFRKDNNEFSYTYELLEKNIDNQGKKGFSCSDVIYLIMPDRFANGDPFNDNHPNMLEKADRTNPLGRHGGDLKGISDHLPYLSTLGITAIWLNPVLENNMPKASYHGYAITDYYNIDARFGTNMDYKNLVSECHKKGIKVIKDMVFNHCGSEHWFIKNLPAKDWIHEFPEFTRSNYRIEVASDPYASDLDSILFEKGWFDHTMPDLNQDNPYLFNYLVQNSIWWIEFAGIDGIRMDTYPYTQKEKMSVWVKRVLLEYPEFNIVGESWLQKESQTAYWQKGFSSTDGFNSNLPVVTDFPLYFALIRALKEPEGWTSGLSELYYVLSQDFLYPDANNNLIFPDNHDVNRIYTSLDHNFNMFKMALSFFFTIRGIPQLYYGTEILMDGDASKSHGFIRQDFPGGWKGDPINAFTGQNLSTERKMALDFTRKLLNWRKSCPIIHHGKLKHFIPEGGTYVYARYDENGTVLVILSKKDAHFMELSRYREILNEYKSATDVISGETFRDLHSIWMEGYSARILELKK